MRPNFIGNTAKYEEKLKQAMKDRSVKIPRDKMFLADWPIRLNTPNFHLSAYYREDNYANPSGKEGGVWGHTGIDIQVALGTGVFAPENGRIIYPFNIPLEDSGNLSNIAFHGFETDLVYALCHIDANSITQKFRGKSFTRSSINVNNQRVLDRGDYLCKVGNWTSRVSDKTEIPEDVKRIYGKWYYHLHISTHAPQGAWKTPWKIPDRFDPLVVFKNLMED